MKDSRKRYVEHAVNAVSTKEYLRIKPPFGVFVDLNSMSIAQADITGIRNVHRRLLGLTRQVGRMFPSVRFAGIQACVSKGVH